MGWQDDLKDELHTGDVITQKKLYTLIDNVPDVSGKLDKSEKLNSLYAVDEAGNQNNILKSAFLENTPGAVTDTIIGTRAVTDDTSRTVVPINAKNLTTWLQGIRDNLNYIIPTLSGFGASILTTNLITGSTIYKDIIKIGNTVVFNFLWYNEGTDDIPITAGTNILTIDDPSCYPKYAKVFIGSFADFLTGTPKPINISLDTSGNLKAQTNFTLASGTTGRMAISSVYTIG